MTLIYFGTSTFRSFKCSYTFFLRSTLYPELQIERHASLVIDGYDLLWDFDVREFQALQLFFLEVLCTQSSRSGATRPSKSTARVHFGTLAFGSPGRSHHLFSWSDFTRSQRSVDACLFQIDGHDLLREFSTLVTPLSSEVAIF
jgi:hypothetical protein